MSMNARAKAGAGGCLTPAGGLDAPVDEAGLLRWLGRRVDASGVRLVQRWARSGVVPGFKLGDTWYFHPRTVLVKAQREAGVSESVLRASLGNGEVKP